MSAKLRKRRHPERALSAVDGRTSGRYVPVRAAGFHYKATPYAHPETGASIEFRIEGSATARAG